MNSKARLYLCIMGILAILLSLPCLAFSQEKGDDDYNEFRRPPEIHGTGFIDRVEKSLIVIGDRQFPLNSDFVIKNSDDESVSSQKLRVGLNVAYELNEGKEIVTVWIIKDKK